jgi:acetylornithine deacetylase
MRLILSGHLDTVGVEGMSSDPFEGEVREGMVWGRGACDMKGGLAIILATAARAAKSGFVGPESPRALIVALSADEEHASIGMQELVASGLTGDAAVVCEPTSLGIMPAHKGFLWIEADFQGRAAHGSRPEEGVDAILHAGCYLAALKALEGRLRQEPEHPLLGVPSFHAGTIEGGSAPSVYPQDCKLVLERRTLPGEDPDVVFQDFEDVLNSLRKEVPEVRGSLKPGLFRPGTEVPTESPLVRLLASSLEAEGVRPVMEGMTAWVETAFLNEAGIPAVCFGPGSIAQAHAALEWVSVEELQVGARVLYRFTESFLGPKA